MNANNNRTALVTGSTSGIGMACAKVLMQHGYSVALHGLVDETDGWQLAREAEQRYGVTCCFVPGNLAVPEQVAQMVASAQSQLGSLAVLVNNGGIQYTAPVDSFPVERWQSILSINLTAAFIATQAALPAMRAAGFGRVINIASVHGLVASVNKSAYVAAKHGLIGFTKATALETANAGITCNAICPGWVDTAIVQSQVADLARQEGLELAQASQQLVANKQPMHAMTAPESIGAMVQFLCSDQAATLTGASIPIDGGWTAQ
ncbi:3-hydroxybutyrate dehydrogenase [Simiduia agarivorans]|uniref:D-beta-hydroxybutyrate dehydrogenase n=1 Tax=Simiduia agarivorans (strain DSM 21679 / JCM 13881 / BCRC 17597 / SA1) TaxID=1117647 RepID=K4KFZ6_SIMAS|nr:3-hydroxybutyrate dehydrogenase [Simiduia agarivorans]AFU98004.1 D-beta-hydroxybutyrate dehydrogenase [Simiduia agarivorans SA1 = DSM 21679]